MLEQPYTEVFRWAKEKSYVIFTHDLDFSRVLALTGTRGPSVVQMRSHRVLSSASGPLGVASLREHKESLDRGAIVVIDETTAPDIGGVEALAPKHDAPLPVDPVSPKASVRSPSDSSSTSGRVKIR